MRFLPRPPYSLINNTMHVYDDNRLLWFMRSALIFVLFIPLIRAIYAVVTYFVVGALINKFYRKASGMDVIPQREFWFQLPFLIKVIINSNQFTLN